MPLSSSIPRFVKLTKTQYQNLQQINESAFYFCTDTQELYIGSRVVTASTTTPSPILFTLKTQYATINQISQVSSTQMNITWYDPSDFDESYATVRTWQKTVLVSNPLRYPTSWNDGTIIIENTVHDAYASTPVPILMPTGATYIALYTQQRDGTWSDYANTPKQELISLVINDLDDFMTALRDGNTRGLNMLYPVGSTLPYIEHSTFTTMTWLIGGYDYKGAYNSVSAYCCDDANAQHNVIMVPAIAPSKASGAQLLTPYDLIEKKTALSADTEFVSGKTYYTNSACTAQYTGTPGVDDTPISLGLYEKGRVIADNGYGRYSESFIRQWLNGEGANWYTPLNIFEPTTYAFATDNEGFLGGFSNSIRQYIHRVNQRYRVYTGNNNYDICQDLIWLPTDYQIFGGGSPQQILDLYDGMTAAQRIFYSYNNTACYVYTGCQGTGQSNNPSHLINISTEGASGNAGKLQGGGQGKDVAMPIFCLA